LKLRLTEIGILLFMLTSCARIPNASDATDAVSMLRQYEGWAWALGIVLLWADLVLPVPQTAVIAALGIIYGAAFGGLVGSVGLITGGLLGYLLMRSLPYSIPEAMVFLAGLAGMPMGKFAAALAVGSIPIAFVFAAIGAGWADQPILALVASYVLPLLLLPIALYLMRLRAS
jgi:uncharacterized membrane protein YdjX (TVP38/TMEM64 family)